MFVTVFNKSFNAPFNTHLIHVYYILTWFIAFLFIVIYCIFLFHHLLPFITVFITSFITICNLGIFITIYSIYFKWCFSFITIYYFQGNLEMEFIYIKSYKHEFIYEMIIRIHSLYEFIVYIIHNLKWNEDTISWVYEFMYWCTWIHV